MRAFGATVEPTGKFYVDYRLPGYTFDKTCCGLIDAHEFAADPDALEVLKRATDAVLPHLPEKIKRPLFKGATGDASKRLNTWLNDIGITDPAKVVHSLRHRAQDCLRAAGCPEDVRE